MLPCLRLGYVEQESQGLDTLKMTSRPWDSPTTKGAGYPLPRVPTPIISHGLNHQLARWGCDPERWLAELCWPREWPGWPDQEVSRRRPPVGGELAGSDSDWCAVRTELSCPHQPQQHSHLSGLSNFADILKSIKISSIQSTQSSWENITSQLTFYNRI